MIIDILDLARKQNFLTVIEQNCLKQEEDCIILFKDHNFFKEIKEILDHIY